MTMRRTEDKPSIRPMKPEDITAILDIDRKISSEYRAVTYNSLITGDLGEELDLSFVAEVGGQVVGFILARHAYFGELVVEAGMIQILGVDPEHRRKGVATQLVKSLLEKCRAKDLKTVTAMINESDSKLKKLLTHNGFRRGALVGYTRTG